MATSRSEFRVFENTKNVGSKATYARGNAYKRIHKVITKGRPSPYGTGTAFETVSEPDRNRSNNGAGGGNIVAGKVTAFHKGVPMLENKHGI